MATAGPPFGARYRYTRGDLFEAARVVHRGSVRQRLGRALLWVGVFLGTLWLVSKRSLSEIDWLSALQQPLVLSALVGFSLIVAFGHYIGILCVLAGYRRYAVADKQIDIVLGAEGIDTDVTGIRSSLPWDKVSSLVERPDRLLIGISKVEFLTLPRRGFADPECYRTAVEYVKKQVEEAASHA
ncbi:YcxB family protein [Bosea sp. CS1GBMeth4]|uniref:YcxB family protein n=1 Tax=Bosea sp. CS1GBMeth4 TaxID=1892849 RepID=UPI0016445FB1|nr:YcxB family protein [Bosea sp. CS1GBMeth4]